MIGKEAAFYFEGEQETYDAVQPLFNGNENVIYVESWQRRKTARSGCLPGGAACSRMTRET